VAAASPGPYANHLHFAQLQTEPRQHFTTQFFTGQMLFLTPNQQRQSNEAPFFCSEQKIYFLRQQLTIMIA